MVGSSSFFLNVVQNRLKMSPSERRAYDRYQEQLHDKASMYESTYLIGEVKGFTRGHVQGHAEGIDEGKRQTIVPAYQGGIAIEAIASFTGLSIDTVKQVLREEGIE